MPLNHVQRAATTASSLVWADYAALQQGRAAQFSDTLLSASYRFAREAAATGVTYCFGMERHGIPPQPGISWADSAWHSNRADANGLAMVQGCKVWMTANFDTVRRGIQQGREAALLPKP